MGVHFLCYKTHAHETPAQAIGRDPDSGLVMPPCGYDSRGRPDCPTLKAVAIASLRLELGEGQGLMVVPVGERRLRRLAKRLDDRWKLETKRFCEMMRGRMGATTDRS